MAAKFDLNDDSVVVVVGSGAGGGTLATDLALKGIKVVCLEAGKRHEIEPSRRCDAPRRDSEVRMSRTDRLGDVGPCRRNEPGVEILHA